MKNIIFIHENSSSSRVIKPVIDIWNYKAEIVGIYLPGHGDAKRNHYIRPAFTKMPATIPGVNSMQ